jgi:hypothetical protein
LRTDRRSRNNLVSDSRAGASAAMTTDSRLSGAQDPASPDAIVDMLHTTLAQLATINKRLELQSETLARHDQLLRSQTGTTASTPNPAKLAATNGQTSVTTGTGGGSKRNDGEGFHQPSTPQHRNNGGDFWEELRNLFHPT